MVVIRTPIAVVVLLAAQAAGARAHEIPLAVEHAQADFTDGSRLRITITLDADSSPFPPNAKPRDGQALDEAIRNAVVRRFWVRFDGKSQPFTVEVQRPAAGADPLQLPISATLTGTVPAGAQRFQFGGLFAGSDLPLQLRAAGRARGAIALRSGILSDPVELISFASRLDVVRRFAGIGFAHILPLGIDHVLFMLGLFFCGVRTRSLRLQVTAFTLAHVLALVSAALASFAIPSGALEALIALSIVAIAFDSVQDGGLRRLRLPLVVVSGLLHGLAFASVLAPRLPASTPARAPALIGFNLGIELGQLVVLGGAALVLWGFRARPWYEPRVAVPASLAIASIGAFWTVERCAQLFLAGGH